MNDDHGPDTPPAATTPPIYTSDVPISSSAVDFRDDDIQVPDEFQTFDVTAAQEETRAKIALNFTNFFLVLVALSMVAPFLINLASPQTISEPLQGAKELLTVLSSVLAAPFGFIVGFYFKQSMDKNG